MRHHSINVQSNVKKEHDHASEEVKQELVVSN